MLLIFNVFQATVAGLIFGGLVRLGVIPFRWRPEVKAKIFYRTAVGIAVFMFCYYQWLIPR
jgi:hypothetical protein